MKTSYKLASVALLGALSVGLVVASETKATVHDGKGKIEFTNEIDDAASGGTHLPPDTTAPILEPTGDGPVPGKEKLQFEYVSPLDFKKHNIVSNAEVKTYEVDTYTEATEAGGTFTMPHFVRFRDLRADEGQENFYRVKAKMKQDFTNGSSILKGTLDYKDLQLGSSANGPTKPDTSAAGAVLQPSFALFVDHTTPANTPEVTVLDQQQAGKGYGRHEIMFGDYDKVNAAGESGVYDSIKLTVPADVQIYEGTYSALVTWTIEDAR